MSRNQASNKRNTSRSKSSTRKTPILAIMDGPAVDRTRISPAKNITRHHVPPTHYTHTETDSHDGIVFVVGHSEFKGDLSLITTKRGFRQRTLLIANIGSTCLWFTNPKDVDAFIRTRFTDALSYQPRNIEDLVHNVKERLRKIPTILKRIKTNTEAKRFFESRGKYNEYLDEYCEREWQFYTQDKEKNPDGRVMLLRRDEKGRPYFKVLYENEIGKGGFKLTKTELYDNLYSKYHLRNVLLVDFGCTNTPGLDQLSIRKLHRGMFGGTKKRVV